MKKTAIMFLAFIVGLCLAHGAFAADKYMVLLIKVNSGNIKTVYKAEQLASNNEAGILILKVEEATPHIEDGQPLPPPSELSRKTYETIFAVSSPGCRYIWHPAGYYVKVCDD